MTFSQQRQHLGTGALAQVRDESVFINCPFDPGYATTFRALEFATICCGFMPRCANESGDSSALRVDRIISLIQSCKYSVHDLSRCHGEGESNLARFNMPLELGMAMGERHRGLVDESSHDWLALVPDSRAHLKAISDLAGFDPEPYDGSKEQAVFAVMAWLATRPDAVMVPLPADVLKALPAFEFQIESLMTSWGGRAPWADTLIAAINVARTNGLGPEFSDSPKTAL